MASFNYTLLVNQDDAILQVKGFCEGIDADSVRAELEEKGLQVLDIREMDEYDTRIHRLRLLKEALSKKRRGDEIKTSQPWWQKLMFWRKQ